MTGQSAGQVSSSSSVETSARVGAAERTALQQGAPPKANALTAFLKRRKLVLMTLMIILIAWELAPRLLAIPDYLLPPPSQVFTAFLGQWQRTLAATWITTSVMLGGYFIAIVVSIPLALAIVSSRVVEDTVEPIMLVFQVIPKIAIAPLFIVWFGFGYTPKTMLVFLLAFFPITLSAVAGFRAVDPDIMDLARSTGTSTWTMFRKIKLPQALPQIFTGLKVGVALASTGAVVAEFIASDRGLGYLLLEWRGELDTPMVFAGVFVISLVGIIVYYFVEAIERFTIPWHVSQREPAAMSA
ncbi:MULTISPECIES: ABC transporter permease [unclassified Chelatococcus]|uniref:ABC transporter permease n=1 Tax=unclassified Chelatococcus TaxID=2638111 RepID=UPI001BCFFD60|nr:MULTISPECIES: ABC transporter permease [unclassified Chelatococcus]MBS7698875.1 ABC transporter permease [Chelatococcus sp. YT9]MBX3559549.1 ABC transporter permease [Chelatococcus sp.]